jgi:hypothetical protein
LPQYNERSGSDQHGSRNNNALGIGHLIQGNRFRLTGAAAAEGM